MKSDLEIQQHIMEVLQGRRALQTAKIGVTVNKGVANLSGTVDNHQQKREAENAALGIEGVYTVTEDLRICLQAGSQRTDSEITAVALTIMRWNTIVPDEKIRLRVRNGWITTEGVVDRIYEKNAVQNSLSQLTGIKGITNLVTVNPGIAIAEPKERICAAVYTPNAGMPKE